MSLRARVTVAPVAAIACLAIGAPPGVAGLKTTKLELTGAGTNYVDLATGEVFNEVWRGSAGRFGKLTTRIAGFLVITGETTFSFQGSFVALTSRSDALIGTCRGTGIIPNPEGTARWACRATGGTGRFERSRGKLTVNVKIVRVWVRDGVQKNRFTLAGSGRLSYDPEGKLR